MVEESKIISFNSTLPGARYEKKWTMRKHFFLRGINKTGVLKQPKKLFSNFYLYLSRRGVGWYKVEMEK